MAKTTNDNDTIDAIFAPLTDRGDPNFIPQPPESPERPSVDPTSEPVGEPLPDPDADQFLHTQQSLEVAYLERESVTLMMSLLM
mmetsp:Transcript_6717/g.6940  ORF Transcript_6717/g.6940 Transcript_6717/m.6940 type:complete len:84 (-) Transcript_6717:173-424(-)